MDMSCVEEGCEKTMVDGRWCRRGDGEILEAAALKTWATQLRGSFFLERKHMYGVVLSTRQARSAGKQRSHGSHRESSGLGVGRPADSRQEALLRIGSSQHLGRCIWTVSQQKAGWQELEGPKYPEIARTQWTSAANLKFPSLTGAARNADML